MGVLGILWVWAGMGGGPLVWYQVLDYGIGHWFQKVGVLGIGGGDCEYGGVGCEGDHLSGNWS